MKGPSAIERFSWHPGEFEVIPPANRPDPASRDDHEPQPDDPPKKDAPPERGA